MTYPSGSVEKIRASNIFIACTTQRLPYFLSLRKESYVVMKAKGTASTCDVDNFFIYSVLLFHGNVSYRREKNIPIVFLL